MPAHPICAPGGRLTGEQRAELLALLPDGDRAFLQSKGHYRPAATRRIAHHAVLRVPGPPTTNTH
jgi:hypothetical protein